MVSVSPHSTKLKLKTITVQIPHIIIRQFLSNMLGLLPVLTNRFPSLTCVSCLKLICIRTWHLILFCVIAEYIIRPRKKTWTSFRTLPRPRYVKQATEYYTAASCCILYAKLATALLTGAAVSFTTCTPDDGSQLGRNVWCLNNRKRLMLLKCEF